MIVDTDVLTWYLRGRSSVARFQGSLGAVILSAVTYVKHYRSIDELVTQQYRP